MAKKKLKVRPRLLLGIPGDTPWSGDHLPSVGMGVNTRWCKIYRKIVLRLCERRKGIVWDNAKKLLPSSEIDPERALIAQDVVAELRELFAAVEAAVREADKRGHERGRNLLLGLALGNTSIAEFNEATLEGER